MKLKNVLIVVKNLEASKTFYTDLFGLNLMRDFDSNMMMTEGLVLQEEGTWKDAIEGDVVAKNNASLLYFEEPHLETFIEKLERLYPTIQYVTKLTTQPDGKKVVRFYDLDGNLIEVGTPGTDV